MSFRWTLEGMRAAGIKLPPDLAAELPAVKRKRSAAWADVGGQLCYFRSTWERRYAQFLQFSVEHGEIKAWAHEKNTFWFQGIKRGTVSYLTDFTVTKNDDTTEEHEVKGWMDPRSKTKIKRMAKYHPNVKLVVIDEAEYKRISRAFSKVIPGWA